MFVLILLMGSKKIYQTTSRAFMKICIIVLKTLKRLSRSVKNIEANINKTPLSYVDKVTSEEVKKAAMLLKPGKGNPSFSFSSDVLKLKSDILCDYISNMIKRFLVYAHVPQFMLLATLVPIIKDRLASINIPQNYRSVCIKSLLLKLVDWITINLFDEALCFYSLPLPTRVVSLQQCAPGQLKL